MKDSEDGQPLKKWTAFTGNENKLDKENTMQIVQDMRLWKDPLDMCWYKFDIEMQN